VALASGRPIAGRATRIGSLLVRRTGDRLRLRRDLQVRAYADDEAIGVRLPR
jgi:hypothetical protein